jgi:cytochrome P450
MHDPKNFPDPDQFIPDRFMRNEVFKNDVRVCRFSLGLRNCIGKLLAIEEYFIFASNMVKSFRLVRFAPEVKLL